MSYIMPSDPSPHRALIASDRPMSGWSVLPPAGRMNARTADRAEARLQEMDRLAATRRCGERLHHRVRDHHTGTDAQGHRHRGYPDRVDRDPPRQYRAGGDLRMLRVLYADLLRLFCTANDRQEARALSHRSALQLHIVFDRPQYL